MDPRVRGCLCFDNCSQFDIYVLNLRMGKNHGNLYNDQLQALHGTFYSPRRSQLAGLSKWLDFSPLDTYRRSRSCTIEQGERFGHLPLFPSDQKMHNVYITRADRRVAAASSPPWRSKELILVKHTTLS